MQIFRDEGFVKEFGPSTHRCRQIGGQLTFYVDTISASDFFADSLEIYPIRCMTSDEQLGILFYVGDPPQNYMYEPYKVYKLKRPYKLVDGTDKLTHSFYVPIPSIVVRDLDLGKCDVKHDGYCTYLLEELKLNREFSKQVGRCLSFDKNNVDLLSFLQDKYKLNKEYIERLFPTE